MRFAEARSSSPSPSRSAGTTETGESIVPGPPRTSGAVAKLAGESCKKTVRSLPPRFAETRSWSPSPSRSAAETPKGLIVVSGPPRTSGSPEKLPGETCKKTVRLLLSTFAETRS